ncbi:hypothetical protein Q3G72_034534 [Acer saccharum]|nr:hypothetical protein Q3G72_034534 [Acer saccharum]
MSSSANEQTTEVGCVSGHDAYGDVNKNAMKPGEDGNDEKDEEEEEDEEEDVDFNPFLKEIPSPEASSSLSSEIVGDSEHGEEEITTQTTVYPEGGLEKENKHRKDVLRNTKKRKPVSISQSKADIVREKENGSTGSGIEVNEGMVGELSNTIHLWNPIMNLDDEDAICRRTRARYSLESFKLDELEAFLQETDDDDGLQNIDDEEEYRKFLAAVLQGGDCDVQSTQENENIDDEDEDNDADFEIELEEMLESDYDEGTVDKTKKEEIVRARRRPETRQNRRQKASVQYKNKLLEQTKRPLRPLLPILPSRQPVASFPIVEGKNFTLENAPRCLSSTAEDASINGFTPHQIGQLHCLIHEHVQLLIQIFSLCILEPSRQQIASQVQGLIFEMLHKRDEVISCRSEPYPDTYFHPPYICSSVPDAIPQIYPGQRASGSSSSIQTVEGSYWVPSVSGPVLSVLDVAPLNLVGKYMDDVYTAVREYRQRRVESSSNIHFEREPLFPCPSSPSLVEANGEVSKGRNLPPANTVPSSVGQQPSKKSLAAALVESTKKQSVALIPKEISKLAQRFFPIFNPSLFPHKPPPMAVANRVLFTDAEDELLALGMMEYNTDWKAIQQRFLPCKNKHQIFVRQKNRCSSKAPENSIKAVRRMKTSPLTAKEIECIQEGLKVFKLDWMSVWKFVVPHRDPTLLRRQWRIALGTQKSYKQDASKKEKRRMYELKRRCKTADLANWHLDSDKEGENIGRENNSGDEYIENADESYVHEGFLADWRPGVSDHGPFGRPFLNLGEKHVPYDTLSREDTHIRGKLNNGSGEAQTPISSMNEFRYSLNNSLHPYPLSNFTCVRHCVSNTSQPNHLVSNMASKTSKSQVRLPPYRARSTYNAHLVKLAPDLPPVNLPPSVRIISQSDFRSDQPGASKKVSANGGRIGDFRQENIVPLVVQSGTPHSIKTGKDKRNPGEENVTNLNSEDSCFAKDKCVDEERGTESDLQMHPLLFQAPEDGHLPYYPLNCSTNMSSSFSFFSGNQPQLNLSLFHNPHQANRVVDCFNRFLKTKESKASCGIDFHPLLTSNEDANTDSMTAPSTSVGLEGKSDQCQNSSVAVQKESLVSGSPLTTGGLHTSSNERANELDLEIHLSSRSAKERASGSGDVITHNSMQPTVSVANSGDKTEYQDTNNIYGQYGKNCSNVVSEAHVSVMTSTSNISDTDDHPHPEIVMEQEELSDSDEEIEEDVEFECEEMADSEGEVGSDSERVAETQDKEIPSLATEKVAIDGDSDDQQQYELRTPSRAQANVCDPRNGTPPFLKLGLTSRGKEHTRNSWLSLNSCAPGRPTRTKSKNEEGLMSQNSAVTNLASCRPDRSCKTPTPNTKKIATQKPATDMAEQLSLGPLAIRTVKKPRKRTSRSNTSLNTGVTTETPKVDEKDDLG